MDHVDKMLTSYSHNKKYLPSIRAAVQLAKNTLNRYYELTDSSETYRIAMGTYLFNICVFSTDIGTSVTSTA
jgi:hypothetical protein